MNIMKKTPKTISNKDKIAIFVDTINYLNKYGEKVKNFIIQKDETNITTYEGKLMFVIKALLETLMDEYGIEVSHESGAVLNLSIRLLQHIRDNKLELVFNEETKEISASIGSHLQPDYAFLKLNKGKNVFGDDALDFELYKNETEIFCHTKEHIKGSLTDGYLEGMCYDGRTRDGIAFHVCFNEDKGLISCYDYEREVFLDGKLKNHKLYLVCEKEYYIDKDEYIDCITLRETKDLEPLSVYSAGATNIFLKENQEHKCMGPLERIILDIPGFIPIARVNDELSIINFKNDCIKDVYPGIYSAAEIIDNKVKKHTK